MEVIHIYHPCHFEKWDHRNLDGKGIGGSETAQVELAWRLARRGYDVRVYAPIPDDCPREWRGTQWFTLEEADFSEAGLWVLMRCPQALDNFKPHDDQELWLLCEDVIYDTMTSERLDKLTRIIALCAAHATFLSREFPQHRDKVCISSNGVRTELMREVRDEAGERNPKKWVYASSPDRGLGCLLQVFSRAREWECDLELHVCYGFDNMETALRRDPELYFTRRCVEQVRARLERTPGVIYHGRTPQRELYKHWWSAGLWVHPTQFTETNCITCQEAQAMGAVPVVSPLWAIGEKLFYGAFVEGAPYDDRLVRARFVSTAVSMSRTPDLQQAMRVSCMRFAQMTYSWERVIDQYECWLRNWRHIEGQFFYQYQHARGSSLNVGCDTDPYNFGKWATNVDIATENPWGKASRAHVYGDIRRGLNVDANWETVILGDLLEHMNDDDAVRSLINSRRLLRPGGHIIVTVPEDHRPEEEQSGVIGGVRPTYADGIVGYHDRPITDQIARGWFARAGLSVARCDELEYGCMGGHGYVLKPEESS